MIELVYSNQTMLNRILNCQSQYNHNKIGDEYLLSRKHIANIQKYPKDWRTVKYEMICMRKRLRAKVIDMRTGKLKRSKLKEEDESAAIKKEALEMEKAAEEARKAKEAEEKLKEAKSERLKALRERKRAVVEWEKASKEWRKARDERLKLIKERKVDHEKKLAEEEALEAKKKAKRREKIKMELEEWRKWKAENEAIKKKEQMKKSKIRYKSPLLKLRQENVILQTERENISDSKTSLQTDSDSSNEFCETAKEHDESKELEEVVFEGGEKVEQIEAEIVQDLRENVDEETIEKEIRGGGTEEEEVEQEIPIVQSVFFEGGQKKERIEEDVVEDLRLNTVELASEPPKEAKEIASESKKASYILESDVIETTFETQDEKSEGNISEIGEAEKDKLTESFDSDSTKQEITQGYSKDDHKNLQQGSAIPKDELLSTLSEINLEKEESTIKDVNPQEMKAIQELQEIILIKDKQPLTEHKQPLATVTGKGSNINLEKDQETITKESTEANVSANQEEKDEEIKAQSSERDVNES